MKEEPDACSVCDLLYPPSYRVGTCTSCPGRRSDDVVQRVSKAASVSTLAQKAGKEKRYEVGKWVGPQVLATSRLGAFSWPLSGL